MFVIGVNYLVILNNMILCYREGVTFVSGIHEEPKKGDDNIYYIGVVTQYNKNWYEAKKKQKKLDKDDTVFIEDFVNVDIPIYAICNNKGRIIDKKDKNAFFIYMKSGQKSIFRQAFYSVGVSYQTVFHVFKASVHWYKLPCTRAAAIFQSNDHSLCAPITSNEWHVWFHLNGLRRPGRSALKVKQKSKMTDTCPQFWDS